MNPAWTAVSTADLVWTVGRLSRLHGRPFDARLLLQRLSPPCTRATFQEVCEALGFRIGSTAVEPRDIGRLVLPCVGWVTAPPAAAASASSEAGEPPSGPGARGPYSPPPEGEGPGERVGPYSPVNGGEGPGDGGRHSPLPRGEGPGDGGRHSPLPRGEGPGERASPPIRPVIILRAGDDGIVFLSPESQEVQTQPLETFAAAFTGHATLVALDTEAPLAEEDAADDGRRFGFRWFVPELLKHKSLWRDVLLASLAIQLMALATPLFTQVVIDKVVVHHTLNTLIVIGIALALFMLFTAAMTWVRQYLVLHTGNRVDAVLGTQVFGHLLHLPARYFEHRPTGVLIARVHGVETIREFVSGAAVTLALDVPFLAIFLAIMFYYSVLLSLVTLGILGVIVFLSLAVVPLLRKRLNHQFLLGARNQAFLTEYVSGMETVKSLQMEPQLQKRFGDYLASYLKAGFDTRQLSNTYNAVANTLEQFLTLTILCVGAWLVMRNDGFTIGMLVAFQMFAGRLSQPMLRIVGLWQEFQQAAIAVKRLGDIMDVPTEPSSLTPSREAAAQGRIEARGLSFRYGENLPYLYRDLDLTIEPGKCVALMGPSGSGKSTLAKLLQGFYRPSDGQITLDGRDIRHLPANQLRSHFGVVPQESVLFSGTVYDNLVLANPHASFEQVIRACKLAEIHDAIEQLPEGYQTVIGEHGAGLSGGQKQRIAIARALLKRPRILVFDEATSHLDLATAEHFARTINQFRGKVTMLFIAHQLPKGLQVDELVMLGGGTKTTQRPGGEAMRPTREGES